jgi:Retroviral aspartyl protease
VKTITALLDSGASGMFIDTDCVKEHKLNTRRLSHPIPVNNINRTPNEAGTIKEIVDVILHYETHTEQTKFAVTRLGGQHMLLRLPWLKEHNPEIDWASGEVKMSCCPVRC